MKRLSNARSRHATPTLSLRTSKIQSENAGSNARPIFHEDDDASPSLDSELLGAHSNTATRRKAAQPLQEVSPNLSPRKTSAESKESHDDISCKLETEAKLTAHPEALSKPESPSKSPTKAPAVTEGCHAQLPAQNLNADLAELLHRTTTSRPNSASERSPEKRKKRPLGRAPSGISNRSNSSNLSPALPAESPEASEADGFNAAKEVPLPPSTQLGYETPEAEAHRLQMSKKMGTKLQDDNGLTRLASVGTVKDTTLASQAGVSGRSRAKQRGK